MERRQAARERDRNANRRREVEALREEGRRAAGRRGVS